MTDPSSAVDVLFAIIATYLIHSTLLLIGCWIVLTAARSTSHALVERAWKIAATLGFVTVAIQFTVGTTSLLPIQLFDRELTVVTPPEPRPTQVPVVLAEDKAPAAYSTVLRSIDRVPSAPSATKPLPGRSGAEQMAPNRTIEPSETPHTNRIVVAPRWATIKMLLVVVTMAWIAQGMLRIAWHSLVMTVRVRRMPVVDSGRIRRLLDRLLKQNRVWRDVCLRSQPQQHDPVALGLWRWTIIVPGDLHESLTDDEIKAVLAHELGHLVRGDVGWLWWGRILSASFGFQPLNLVARRRWQRASEYLSDQWAVDHGTRRLDLAKSLTTLAASRVDEGGSRLALAATGSKATLVSRVERLLDRQDLADAWQSRPRVWLTAVIATAIVATMIAVAPSVQATGDEADSPADAANSHPPVEPAPPVILARIDPDTGLADFESIVQLEGELSALIADLNRAADLVEASPRSDQWKHQIEPIRAAITALQQRQNELSHHFTPGE